MSVLDLRAMNTTHKIAAHGVSPILPTPFTDDGAVDYASLRRLIDFQKHQGVTGVSILGWMGENDELSGNERSEIIRTVVEVADCEIDVWVGVRALGTMGAIEAAQQAEAAGANALFVAPASVQNDAVQYRHFELIHNAVGIPIMIHDYPQAFGVTLSVDLISRLAKDGLCPYIKLEDTPIGQKMTALREASNDAIGIFGGLGAFYFIEELERGSLGIMTGFSFSNALVEIYNLFASGKRDAAAAAFDRYAGIIRYEFQPGIGLALRKHAYHRRGIFESTFVRRPSASRLTAYDQTEYERVIARAGLSIDP